MAEGIDYSYGGGLSAAAMKRAGKHFVARYLSTQPNSKNISSAEARNLLGAGLSVVLVWETTADRVLSGRNGGVADAREADRQANALGMRGIPLYFACDIDSSPGQQGAINGYCSGAASVIGHGRTGLYGGYWPVSRAFSAGVIRYGWQTYAWSGGNLDRRAQLYQYRNGVKLGPADVDLDKSMATDYGQWPRPAGQPVKAAAVAKLPVGVHQFDGKTTMGEVAKSRNYGTTLAWVNHEVDLSAHDAEYMLAHAVPPRGTYWRATHN
jgi:Domain of unknown function (DUF1906)